MNVTKSEKQSHYFVVCLGGGVLSHLNTNHLTKAK